ncbi:MAG: hypothetical protein IT429_04660 [Gemmataceae bacterium]|nr:hypothetical protein [Gemmataceae bacterium]
MTTHFLTLLRPGAREALRRGLRALQLLAAAAVVLFCLRGQGRPSLWLALLGGASLLRLVLDGDSRRRTGATLAGLAASVREYADRRGTLPWRAALALVVLPAVAVLLVNSRTIGGGDSWPVTATASSLVLDGDWEIGEFAAGAPDCYRFAAFDGLPYCLTRTAGGLYSKYPSGMVPFALPTVAAARLVGADLNSPGVRNRLEKWTAAWVGAGALGLFFLTALHVGRPLPAALATVLLATGSAVFSTVGQALWQQGGVIFWLLTVLLIEFRSAGRPSLRATVLQGAACAMMLACRLSAAVIVVPLGIWVLARAPRRALVLGASAALAYLPWAAVYGSIHGNPFGPSTGQLGGGNWGWSGEALLGLLLSPGRGLLVYQPWAVLAVFAFLPVAAWRGSGPAGWRWFCLAASGLQVGLVAAWCCWWGGHCWGSRLLAEVVPLCALLCVGPIGVLCRGRAGRAVLAVLAAVALIVHAAGVFWEPCWEVRTGLDRNPEVLWSWPRAPFLIQWTGSPGDVVR